jgi:hypothetical protein
MRYANKPVAGAQMILRIIKKRTQIVPENSLA